MDADKLKAKLILKHKTVDTVCEDIGISRAAWYRKVAGTSDFTRKEIAGIVSSLSLDEADLVDIFFTNQCDVSAT